MIHLEDEIVELIHGTSDFVHDVRHGWNPKNDGRADWSDPYGVDRKLSQR